MGAPAEQSRPRSARWVAPAVLGVGLALSGTAAALVQATVADDQAQLLRQRATEVKETLLASAQAQVATMSTLAAVVDPAGSPDATAFRQAAPELLGQGVTAIGLVRATGGTLRNLAVVGPAAATATASDVTRAGVIRRSLAARGPASGMIRTDGMTHIVFAVPTPKGDAAVYQQTSFVPSMPVPSADGTPYAELRVAVYAGAEDTDHLLFATDSPPRVEAGDLRVTIPFGPDAYTLVIGSRDVIGGGINGSAPWLVLGGGALLTLAVAAMAHTLARRRTYALALVESRTTELRVLNEFLEQVLSRGPMVVLRGQVADGVPTTGYASANLVPLFGIEPEALAAEGSMLPWVLPEDRHLVEAGRARLASATGHQVVEFRLQGADGTARSARSVAFHEVDPETGSGSYAIYLTDVSAERAAQEVLRQAAADAEAANRSKTQFLSRMSHELRTPLNAIIGFGQLAVAGSSGEARADAEQIVKAGQHLLSLINEVLEITGIEAGAMRLSPEPVAVTEVVAEAVDLIRPIADRAGIHVAPVRCRCGTGSGYVYADRQRTKQVVLNLLSNAVKYNRVGGSVAVTCAPGASGRLQVRVSDTGPGIPPEAQEAAFAPFERLGAANSAVEGTGIGLSLSRHLAQVMGGSLTVESTLGSGSTFVLDLPATEGPVERLERLEASVPAQRAGERAGGTGTVLYIEDNLPNLRLIERVLGRRPGLSLITAMQGRLGIDLAREHRPALVLLDLHLADTDGEQVLRELRADPSTADLPVVVLSADATPGMPARLLTAGAVAYLTKPIDIDELLRAVDAVVEPSDDPAGPETAGPETAGADRVAAR